MLIDKKERAIKLFIDSLFSGSITSDLLDLTKIGYNADHLKLDTYNIRLDRMNKLHKMISRWLLLYESKKDEKKLSKLTDKLFDILLKYRVAGIFRGSFKEIAQLEKQLEKCRKDNEALAKELIWYKSKERSEKGAMQYG